MWQRSSYPELQDDSWLWRKYHEDGLTLREIAAEVGCSSSTVQNWLNVHDIEARASGKPPADERLRDKQWMVDQYFINQQSQTGLAEELDCCRFTVRYWLEKHNIPTRQGGELKSRGTGPDNPNWKGGNRKYGPNWYEQRRKARERDGHECRACGISEPELDYELHVHHVTPRRQFIDSEGNFDHEGANRLDNLITLCQSCHPEWEGIPLKPQGGS